MDFLTVREAAEKWGVTPRQVQRLIAAERIPGVKRYGQAWLIPADAEKPADPRRTPGAAAEPTPEYSFLPALYIHGGDLDAAFARCNSPEERSLLQADLAFMRGKHGEARALAAALYKSTGQPQLKLGAGLILALSAMCFGDPWAWKEIQKGLSELKVPPRLQREKEFVISAVNAGLHNWKDYPAWLDTGAFTGLSPELFPAARWVYVSILYIKWKEVDLLAVAEPLIAECRREQSDLCQIYLHVLAATAYQDHGRIAQAREHIHEAVGLARPVGFIEPFIEYRRGLAKLLDAALKQDWPEALPLVKKQMQPFLEGWAKVYSAVWNEPVSVALTPREHEACGLAVRGMGANEIARRMGITSGSVKKYLNSAYNKLGIKEKEQLTSLIHS